MSDEREMEQEFDEELAEIKEQRAELRLSPLEKYIQTQALLAPDVWREIFRTVQTEGWKMIVGAMKLDLERLKNATLDATSETSERQKLGESRALRSVIATLEAIERSVMEGKKQWQPTRTPKPPEPKRKTAKRKAKSGKRRSKRAT